MQVTIVAWWASDWWSAGMVIFWSKVQIACIWFSYPIVSASAKSRMVYPSGTDSPVFYLQCFDAVGWVVSFQMTVCVYWLTRCTLSVHRTSFSCDWMLVARLNTSPTSRQTLSTAHLVSSTTRCSCCLLLLSLLLPVAYFFPLIVIIIKHIM